MASVYTAGSGAWKLNSPKWKRYNVFPISLIALLCSIFYILGFLQHSPSTPATSVHFSAVPCSAHNTSATLDFSAHHASGGAEVGSPAGRSYPPCNVSYSEYTPCEDRDRSLNFEREMLVYRERHCPEKRELLKCLVPAPFGYRNPFQWPASRELAWFANVPHKELVVEKAVQNWVRVEGDKFRFPGGGTMFPHGADAYIDDIAKLISLSDGHIRTAVDTGCGVASWGAYLLSRNITTMSFAPRDTHEAQVQFALERGVPAMIGIIASNRLPYPSRAFDMAHCSRCLIPWHLYDGLYLIEVDRILRPGGYWILSGPPINWKSHWRGWERTQEDLKGEQSAIEAVAKSLCWKKLIEKGDIAIWQKPTNHIHCKLNRKISKSLPFCPADQDSDNAWYTKMENCITPLPQATTVDEISGGKLKKWPERLTAVPPRISSGNLKGIWPLMFLKDTDVWKKRVGHYKALNSQLAQKGRYRNLLDMNAHLGGFAAALVDDPVWVMNVVPADSEINTLGVIYERGLIGAYHNWCEAMSTYPRTYDLIHADSIFSLYQDRCEMEDILLEMDRILRPEGTVIFRDDVDMLLRIKRTTDGMRWKSQIVDHENGPLVREKILLAVKTYWTAPAQDKAEESSNTQK